MAAEIPQVEFIGAGLTYGSGDERVQACRDLTFSILPGQSVALIGPSGCGKSTTLLMSAGLIAPTQGQVLVAGKPIARPREETAFMPQDLGLFPWKTVLQNAMLGLLLHGMPRAQAEGKARRALHDLGLGDFERAYPKDLSGGMRQRLALARALVMDADLLLMDEPLSAIDALLRESLQDMLLGFWKQRHVAQMLVTHSIEEAVYLGQRIIVFSQRPGTIVGEIANPNMGEPGWRDSDVFSRKCNEVRALLATDLPAEASAGEVRSGNPAERSEGACREPSPADAPTTDSEAPR